MTMTMTMNFKVTFSIVLVALTLIVVIFQSIESTTYLKAVKVTSNTVSYGQSYNQSLTSTATPPPTTTTPDSNATASMKQFVQQKQKQLEEQQQASQSQVIHAPPSFLNDHPMCRRIAKSMSDSDPSSSTILNAGNVWMKHWDAILSASYYPIDGMDPANKEKYKNLLLDVGPAQLEQGLLTVPRQEHIERVWNILENRRTDNSAPPLRVLVMGGSVAEGVGCEQMKADGTTRESKGRGCSWPGRVESFVNNLLGYDAVQVTNIAQGGTSTSQALSIIKYWMYPKKLNGAVPDIIIHAFGSNDSHLGSVPGTEMERIIQLHEQGVSRLNAYIQAVQKSHPCPTPIVIHLDDYFSGHQQGALIGDFTYRMILKEVAGWYRNMAVSSAQVVDDYVYPDPMNEGAFSPPWRPAQRGPQKGKIVGNVHFGFPGHLAILWTWMYSSLKAAVQFCNDKDWEEHQENKVKRFFGSSDAPERSSFTNGMVHNLRGVNPPPLDYELDLENISQKWREEKVRQENHCKTVSKNNPCVMAWVAG
jgi:hypothetical protein